MVVEYRNERGKRVAARRDQEGRNEKKAKGCFLSLQNA
jgi:hypothetical protein